jgi:hypothetical protein
MEAIEVIRFNEIEQIKSEEKRKAVFIECVQHTMNLAQTDNPDSVIMALKKTNIHIGVFIREKILHVVLVPFGKEVSSLFELINDREIAKKRLDYDGWDGKIGTEFLPELKIEK